MLYAAYGSNLHPLRLVERLAAARLLGTARLPGWTLCCNKRSVDGSAKCNIASGSDGVHVAVYDVSDADMALLDAIEGVGNGYDDSRIAVPGFGECRTYLAQPAFIDTRLPAYRWYRDLVLAGCRYHRFPEHYSATVAGFRSVDDTDADRRRRNERTLVRLR